MNEEVGTIPGALRRAAARYGDRPAFVDGQSTLSFTELHAEVRRTARAYVALGVQPGDRIALWAPNGVRWAICALAASYAGGSLVPLNTRYKGFECAELLLRTDARVLVVDHGFLGRAQLDELRTGAGELDAPASASGERGGPVPQLPELLAVVALGETTPEGAVAYGDLAQRAEAVTDAEVEERADAVGATDVADILFTSGTTGRPKGVVSGHLQTLDAAGTWAQRTGVDATDRYLIVNPFFHSFGYKAGILVCLLSGATAYPMATFDADAMVALIARAGITVLPGAPAIFHALFEADADPGDLASLRIAVTGAASVPVALVERMQSELGFERVLTAYGQTECVTATMCLPGDPDELVATSCGVPMDGLELRILDPETRAAVAVGGEGEVCLRGRQVMQGYLDDPAATAAAIDPEGWLHTGDIGRVDGAGYLRITDRLKDMYISGGFNVYPAEVEQALARLEGVVEAAVIGVPDERMGEVGKAFVVRRGAQPDAHAVVGFARERLANFKVPREVEFVESLPRNLSGKVLKNVLRGDNH